MRISYLHRNSNHRKEHAIIDLKATLEDLQLVMCVHGALSESPGKFHFVFKPINFARWCGFPVTYMIGLGCTLGGFVHMLFVKTVVVGTLQTYVDSFVIHWPQATPSSGKTAGTVFLSYTTQYRFICIRHQSWTTHAICVCFVKIALVSSYKRANKRFNSRMMFLFVCSMSLWLSPSPT